MEMLNIPFEYLETDRLHLRIITPGIFRTLVAELGDEELKSFLGLYTPEAFERVQKRYRNGCEMFDRTFLTFQMLIKEGNRLIGGAGFHNLIQEHNRSEIGYMLFHDEDKNKGYMKEALREIIAYGFDELELNRMEAYISPTNEASKKLVEGFGFQYEGLLKEHFIKNGDIDDSMLYALLKASFQRKS